MAHGYRVSLPHALGAQAGCVINVTWTVSTACGLPVAPDRPDPDADSSK
jgi:hypothetical protein